MSAPLSLYDPSFYKLLVHTLLFHNKRVGTSPQHLRMAPMKEKLEVPLEAAARLLRQAKRIVCLTGAGVSAESGVATFRATTDNHNDSLWSRFDPQQLASQEGFAANPGMVWQWYMHRLDGSRECAAQ